MKLVIQRAAKGAVAVNGETVGAIETGAVVLVGVCPTDTESDAAFLASKLYHLRFFEDEAGKMNLSLADVKGSILAISQFTLYADCSAGRRPSFTGAARPEKAKPLYEHFVEELRRLGAHVETGVFGAMMEVSLINNGPVTFILESTPK